MLKIDHLSKSFENHPILTDLTFEVAEGEIVVLLGASGGGKTTLLRCIAGLETPNAGKVWLNGQPVTTTPANKRGIGLMFQDYALFPHMNVAQNVAFGLEMQGLTQEAIHDRVQEVLTLVGLETFGDRAISTLSGGEQQRVSLARSLAPNPRALLLDEPLGSLDAALREHLMMEIRDILKKAGVTAIYVTHDQSEAFSIADRIGILQAGQLVQIDSPHRLYLRPINSTAAEFLGLRNIIPIDEINRKTFAHQTEELYEARTPLGSFVLGRPAKKILLHPAFLQLMSSEDKTTSFLLLKVTQLIFKGGQVRLDLSELNTQLQLSISIPISTPDIPPVGEYVQLRYLPEAVIPLEG